MKRWKYSTIVSLAVKVKVVIYTTVTVIMLDSAGVVVASPGHLNFIS